MQTVEGMVHKTLLFLFDHSDFKILGCSRTDSKVSANHSAFELFLKEPVDMAQLLIDLNKNLPNDIRVLTVEEVDSHFSIINAPRTKEYTYPLCLRGEMPPFLRPAALLLPGAPGHRQNEGRGPSVPRNPQLHKVLHQAQTRDHF